jgi:RNA polymerase sigma-70 factor, ECF subfamily
MMQISDQPPEHGVHEEALALAWRAHHGRLLNVAYRMLGSVRDAEDIVGETYARLVGHGLDGIDDPRGWLVAVTSRLCLDRLRSFEVRRREYVGPWLPEPIVEVASGDGDLSDRITLDDSVRMALLVVLEQLSPAERTAFVLHEVFAMPFEEIGALVGRTPAACRQLASRARRRVDADPAARFHVDPLDHRRVAEQFAAACRSGDLGALTAVLDPGVTGDFDSGGALPGAPIGPLRGAVPIAQLLNRVFDGMPCVFEVTGVNGEPGVVVGLFGRIVAVISIAVKDGRVSLIHAVGNPAKLPQLREM